MNTKTKIRSTNLFIRTILGPKALFKASSGIMAENNRYIIANMVKPLMKLKFLVKAQAQPLFSKLCK
jgi:hypothetical protein